MINSGVSARILRPMQVRCAAGNQPAYGRRIARLARGSAAAMVIYVAGAGLAYGAQLVIARAIGAPGYGTYAYVLAWMTVLCYVAALGFDVSLLRFIPAYLAWRKLPLLQGVIQYATRRVTAIGGGIAVIGVAVTLLTSTALPSALTNTFLVGFALVPLWALVWILASVARGFGGVIPALAPDRLIRDGMTVVLVLTMSQGLGWRLDASRAMAVTVLAVMISLVVVARAVHRLKPTSLAGVAAVYDLPIWRRTALPLVVINATEALMNRTGVMLLAWIADARSTGTYAVAFNLAFAVTLPRTAVNILLAPEISDLFVRGDREGLRSIVAQIALWTLLGAGVIALPLVLFAHPLLALFGHDFESGASALRILVLGQLVAAAAGSQLHLLNMTGHERCACTLLVLSAAGNGAIGAAFVAQFGLAGAALATTMAVIGWNAAMGFWIWRYLHLLPGVLSTWPVGTKAVDRSGVSPA